MIINFTPQMNGQDVPVLYVNGDSISINGEIFDFSKMSVGDVLPVSAIKSVYFDKFTNVTKTDKGIELTLMLPFTFESSEEVRFPKSIDQESGFVKLPT